MNKTGKEKHGSRLNRPNKLGVYLRKARLEKGYSAVQLAELTDVNDATIIRIETGFIEKPAADKLTRIAEALEISTADVYALAGYSATTELPNFTPYLRTKYNQLPEDALKKIENYTAKLIEKYGMELEGPAPGEDE